VGGDRPTSVVNTSLCSKTKEIRARYRSGLLMSKNAFAAGAPPRTPPEELTALPRPHIAGGKRASHCVNGCTCFIHLRRVASP